MEWDLDLARLQQMQAELSLSGVIFTRHKSTIGNVQDWWFGTRRVEGDTYAIVLYGLVTSFINALTDLQQPHTLSEQRLVVIRAGLSQMAEVSMEFLFGDTGRPVAWRETSKVQPGLGELQAAERILHPMRRWRAGHQLFFTAIQTLNMLFAMTRRAVDNAKWVQADKYIRKAAFFMNMSARSIEYASNYHRVQYEEQIRPLMPPGFSGLMLADHTLMIALLKDLRETVFSEPPEPLTESVGFFLGAMEECYDAHNVICETFVNQGPSLRDIDNSKNLNKPATEMLDKLKKKRKRMLSSNSSV
jgi:hypothetical protein